MTNLPSNGIWFGFMLSWTFCLAACCNCPVDALASEGSACWLEGSIAAWALKPAELLKACAVVLGGSVLRMCCCFTCWLACDIL